METKIEHKKNWLSENIVSLLALVWTVFTILIFVMILFRNVKTTDATTITILSTVSNVELIVLTYYFSSTKNSKDKDKQIENLTTAQSQK